MPALVLVDDAIRVQVESMASEIAASMVGVSVEMILSRSRLPGVVGARNRLMVRLWRSGLSVGEVARVLGRDHTGVMHGLRRAIGPEAYRAETLARYSPNMLPCYRGRVAS